MNNGTESVFDPKNATYTIEGDSIALINGKAEKEIAPGSASKIEVMAWGEPAIGDLSAGEANDAALILAYSAGGSGTFYYVVAALKDPQSGKAMGTNAIILGDRIAPQNISIDIGKIIVNYANRKNSEPFSVTPTVGITRTFSVQGGTLMEVTTESARKENICSLSGGKISTSLCCQSSGDFPNSCLIGACGCAPSASHEVKVCDCGDGKCFDGIECVATNQITFCNPSQRQGDVCFQIYDPVCAKVNIQCIKAPCDPVRETFSNACEACRNSLVESYTQGECVNIK
ncbi:MAG: hypothetical protein NTV01_19905 [Bacteroidia bacterium]|nr:hypothetical protein [Bacteroidia bacterium]